MERNNQHIPQRLRNKSNNVTGWVKSVGDCTSTSDKINLQYISGVT